MRAFPGTGNADLTSIQVGPTYAAISLSTVGTGVSNTEFLTSLVRIDVDKHRPTWPQVDRAMALTSTLGSMTIPDDLFVIYGADSLHRSRPAKMRGYRLFLRVVNRDLDVSRYGPSTSRRAHDGP